MMQQEAVDFLFVSDVGKLDQVVLQEGQAFI